MAEEIALELARLEREVLARVRAKFALGQLGEAWNEEGRRTVAPAAAPTPTRCP